LPAEGLKELAETCRVDDEQRESFEEAVENVLGEYHGNKTIFDEVPSPASILAGLRPLWSRGIPFLRTLAELDAASELELIKRDFGTTQLRELTRLLEHLLGAVRFAEVDLDKPESRGQPRKTARRILIHQLSDIFDRFAGIETKPNLAGDDRREYLLDFIEGALEAANESFSSTGVLLIDSCSREGIRRLLPTKGDHS
jgi:hypothetical protein